MFEDFRIILASASPRRTELLRTAGIAHEVIPSFAEEDVDVKDPRQLVEMLSARKAQEVFDRISAEDPAPGRKLIVIGADTVVSLDAEILGKPEDRSEAASMIRSLAGRSHHVYTGVSFCTNEGLQTDSEESTVYVAEMTDCEIADYLATGECDDKAGAYGIQGAFMKYVSGISGDYFNIVGLPVSMVYRKLRNCM